MIARPMIARPMIARPMIARHIFIYDKVTIHYLPYRRRSSMMR